MKLLIVISLVLVIVGCGFVVVNFIFPHMISVQEAVQVPSMGQTPVLANMGGEAGYMFVKEPMGIAPNTPNPPPSVKLYQAQSILTWRETHVTGYTNETQYRTELVPKEANSNLYLYFGSCVIGVGVVLMIVDNALLKRRKTYLKRALI